MCKEHQISCYFCEDEAPAAYTADAADLAADSLGFVIGWDYDSNEAQYACSDCAEQLENPLPLVTR